MPESPPSRGRAATQASAGPARDYSRSTAAPQVNVRYYSRMRPNRVYPVVVSWRNGGNAASPVTVRLVMAGAQVVPAEQTLEAGAGARATFNVTPIARGWMRNERLEVLQDGRKVQEIRLPCKATTQRATWVLLLLTIIVAWWVVPLLTQPIRELKTTQEEIFEGEPRLYYEGTMAMEVRLQRFLPRTLPAVRHYLPEVADQLEEIPPYVASSAYVLNDYQRNHNYPIAEGLLGVLILLTVWSWLAHLERRKRRIGRALPLSGAAD